ncbi:MAG: hypothetical protein AB7D96_10700 [Arcobacteraceae bacterium]
MAKMVKVEALTELHIPGKKTVKVGSIIELEEAQAKTLAALKKPAVKIIDEGAK